MVRCVGCIVCSRRGSSYIEWRIVGDIFYLYLSNCFHQVHKFHFQLQLGISLINFTGIVFNDIKVFSFSNDDFIFLNVTYQIEKIFTMIIWNFACGALLILRNPVQ